MGISEQDAERLRQMAIRPAGFKIIELDMGMCRFPVTGNVPQHKHRFCGKKVFGKSSYCGTHHKLVYERIKK